MSRTKEDQALANALALRYQNGEAQALGELYSLLIPYMVHKAQCSGAGDEAWDIAHDAFLRVSSRIADKSNSALVDNVLAYATTATHRLTLNLLRGKRRAMMNIDSRQTRGSLAIIDRTKSPEDIVDARMREEWYSKLLADALSKLPEVHSNTVRLRYVHDMAYAKIGETTGAPIDTVTNRLHYSLTQLGRVLANILKPEQREELFPDR
ncbi:sigma-70 family RNA polymerase sigma factor [Candidatus Parcubacteria bacterium]|nr:sigma-70 family RNA polymerase sigma factor [Candidatus Parcubacteria bacterium]